MSHNTGNRTRRYEAIPVWADLDHLDPGKELLNAEAIRDLVPKRAAESTDSVLPSARHRDWIEKHRKAT